MARAARVTKSSGNVFADLGLPKADERYVKSFLSSLITKTIRARSLTQLAAGRLLGIAQPKVSELVRGSPQQFSLERLLVFVRRLGYDVEVVVSGPRRRARSTSRRRRGRLRVTLGPSVLRVHGA